MEGLTIATGHFRNGILLTPITAKLVREWIVDKTVSMDWEIFSPLRFAAAASAGSDPASGDPTSSVPSSGNPSGAFARK